MMQIRPSSIAPYVAAMALGMGGEAELCQAAEPAYLSDRGDGIPTSLLGTYVGEKEFIFYPFYEYTRFKKFEYKPSELGFTGEQEFFGKLVEREALVFLAYAFNDSLAIEFESAVHASADFTKAPEDASSLPATIRESGLGDTETNIRWRYLKETQSRPEVTFFMKTVFPLQRDKKLLGTPGNVRLMPLVEITSRKRFPRTADNRRLERARPTAHGASRLKSLRVKNATQSGCE